jgi:uncharacterized low-complexity protein
MNSELKHTIIAMAMAGLSVATGCKSDAGPQASEATAGAEVAATQQRATHEGAAEASCGEGSCGESHQKKGDASEASCGEGTCG